MHFYLKLFKIKNKAERIIESCTKVVQLSMAEKWIEIAFKKILDEEGGRNTLFILSKKGDDLITIRAELFGEMAAKKYKLSLDPGSSSGRTPDFESGN